MEDDTKYLTGIMKAVNQGKITYKEIYEALASILYPDKEEVQDGQDS